MHGYIWIIPPVEDLPPPPAVEITEVPSLETLKAAIGGGWLQVIPLFETIKYEGKLYPCAAFCDEEGKLKQLPMNVPATLHWATAAYRKLGNSHPPLNDFLVGPVVVIFGDAALLSEL